MRLRWKEAPAYRIHSTPVKPDQESPARIDHIIWIVGMIVSMILLWYIGGDHIPGGY